MFKHLDTVSFLVGAATGALILFAVIMIFCAFILAKRKYEREEIREDVELYESGRVVIMDYGVLGSDIVEAN